MKPKLTALLALLMGNCAFAQWQHPTPGIPRSPNGKPILSAPAPKKADGTPDLSGVWIRREGESAPKESNQQAFSLAWFRPAGEKIPLRPAAEAIFKQRADRDGAGRPSERCLPHGVPGSMLPATPFKMVETTGLTLILFEDYVDFRQIFTDGRGHPKSMSPAWYGYSTGKWDGDAFVVDTRGFTDASWLDGLGLPHSDQLHVIERFRRVNVGLLDLQGTIDDPPMYTQPWTFHIQFNMLPDSDLIEYLCENEKDAQHELTR